MSESTATSVATGKTTVTTTDPQRPNLNFFKRFQYAAGDIGCNCAYAMINAYLFFFMTDIARINPMTVGTVMLISKVWDAAIDPFIGSMADHTETKWGRYRPWVIGAAIPMVVLNVMAFTTFPEWNETARTLWAFTAYFASVTAYSALNIPYSAMTATLTLDSDMRAKIASTRIMGAMATGLVLNFFTLRIVKYVTNIVGSEATGYQVAAIIFGLIALPFFFICFFGTKEVVKTEPTKEKYSTMFKTLKNNKPFWCLTFFYIVWGFNALGGSMKMHFFTYYVGKQMMTANNATIGSFASFLGTMSLTFIVKYFKNKGHIIGYAALGSCIFQSIAFFIPVQTAGGEIWYYCNTFLASFCSGCALGTMFAVQPDITEYTRYHHGIYAAGFLSAFTNFCFQFGGALASASSGWILGGFGYVAGQEQTPQVMMLLRIMPHFWPALMMLMGSIAMFMYPLSKEKYNEITAKLEKGEYAPGVVPMSRA